MDEFVRRPKRPQINMADAPVKRAVGRVEPRKAPEPTPAQKEEIPDIEIEDSGEPEQSSPKKPKSKFKFPRPHNKWQWGILIAAIVLLLAGTGFAVYYFILRDTTPPIVQQEPEPEPEPEPIPTTEASRVSGRQIPIGQNARPIYAVQIENSPEARPQSGLREADIVSEAVAEGGITRFNVIFHDNIPPNIGPVRSLRPYYIDWFLPYDAAIVHAGGSPEALADVRNLGLKDADSVSSIMRRISSRYSPHNYYTTGQQVLDLMSQRGYSSNVSTSLLRKEPAPAATPTASTINLKISSALYNVTFTYDKTTNRYLRAQGGSPHIDAESGQQLSPDVVVVPVLPKSLHPDRVHTKYGTTGSGKAFIFQDGSVTEGTWTKPDRGSQWQLKDAAGNIIALNPGQTWFTIIDSAGSVSYQP